MNPDGILKYAIKNRMLRAVEMLTTAPFPHDTGQSQKAYEKMHRAIKDLREAAEDLAEEETIPNRRLEDL